MKKSLSLLLSCLLAASVLTGCAGTLHSDTPATSVTGTGSTAVTTAPADSETGAVTLTDDLGRTVRVEKTDRVAALLGSYADLWQLAGGTVCASADDAWEDLRLDLPADAVNIGSAHRPNLEKILASRPDLVLASPKLSRQRELMDTFESAGIPVLYLDVPDFAGFLRVFRTFTDLTGHPERFDTYGTAQKTVIDGILSAHKDAPAQKVLVMRASAASIRAKNSDGTMLGGMLRDFGCVNIADSDKMLLEDLNIESILAENPDKLFFVETGDDPEGLRANVEQMFRENPLWQELDAVKNGQVYFMDKHLYNLKPNARFAEAYQGLERILYGQ